MERQLIIPKCALLLLLQHTQAYRNENWLVLTYFSCFLAFQCVVKFLFWYFNLVIFSNSDRLLCLMRNVKRSLIYLK